MAAMYQPLADGAANGQVDSTTRTSVHLDGCKAITVNHSAEWYRPTM